MKHLIISRELAPAAYPAGGIGTYVGNIARLLAEAGEVVHLIGERWAGAPHERDVQCDGRLIIHRIGALDLPPVPHADRARARREMKGLSETVFPTQWFAWSAGLLAERLVEEEGIDVIEAQEWEAPLYHFLLRRSLGLGPDRRPPCIVHLHSPSVLIHHYNGPAVTPPRLSTMTRMEAFCIQSADALLCPSRRLAADAARIYQRDIDAIEVIPLPIGPAPRLERDPSVWARGGICYVGRLEPRKGVIEWVEAAVRVAREDPRVHFDFVGADVWNLQGALAQEIGAELAPRFRFHGAKTREELSAHLSQATAAVVPSRWENFPNVCIEAMASGLPVIATRHGAMAELIDDGQTGWLAEDGGVAGMVDTLADALRRCLDTAPTRRAAMGDAAAAAVRRICDNREVVAAHLRFRQEVMVRGPVRSPGACAPAMPVGSAHVVVRADTLAAAKRTLRSLEGQTTPPGAVVVVYGGPAAGSGASRDLAEDVLLHHAPTLVGPQAWNAGFERLAARGTPGFWLFLDEHDTLEPDCLQRMAEVFARRPDVGVVTPWTDRGPGGLDAAPLPTVHSQMTGNDVAPASGVRAEALAGRRPFKPGLPREHDIWALSNMVIADGWNAVTLPAVLASRAAPSSQLSWTKATALRALRAEALAPFESDANHLALQLVDAYVPLTAIPPAPSADGTPERRALWRYAKIVLLHPDDALRRLVGRTRLILGKSRRGRAGILVHFLRGAVKP